MEASATILARIESESVGSPTHEKAITEVLNAINGVQEVIIENGAIHVTAKKGQSFLLTLL